MRLGMMNHKITIKSAPRGKDTFGQTITDWQEVKTVYASKEALVGREFYTANQQQTNVEVKFRTHYFDNMDNSMRIYHNNDIYEIVSVSDPDDRRVELLWLCKKVKA